MHKRTRKCEFSKKERERIYERDYEHCIFCAREYHMLNVDLYSYSILEVMHFIPRSQGGLGIAENGALGCKYHHMLMDNGNKGLREEMLHIMQNHLEAHHENWNKENLYYKKGM